MTCTHVTQKEIDDILANGLRFGIDGLKGTCLLRDVAFDHSYNFPRVNLYIIGADAVADVQHRYWFAVGILLAFVNVVKAFRVGIMEVIPLNHDVLGQTYNGRHDTASGGKVSLAYVVALL